MINDPIVEDVYRARQKILDECHNDLAEWIERLRDAERQHPQRLVTRDDVQRRRRLKQEHIDRK
ncbi:MAG: hypothetical protein GXP27_10240 [Planctomycetes bacterium]|nr:hypothetical protein [Planctomycetota bacterium]